MNALSLIQATVEPGQGVTWADVLEGVAEREHEHHASWDKRVGTDSVVYVQIQEGSWAELTVRSGPRVSEIHVSVGRSDSTEISAVHVKNTPEVQAAVRRFSSPAQCKNVLKALEDLAEASADPWGYKVVVDTACVARLKKQLGLT